MRSISSGSDSCAYRRARTPILRDCDPRPCTTERQGGGVMGEDSQRRMGEIYSHTVIYNINSTNDGVSGAQFDI